MADKQQKSKYRYIVWKSNATNKWHLTVSSRQNNKVIMTTEGYSSKATAVRVFETLLLDEKTLEYEKSV